MLKNYIIWQLKKWWPLALIMALSCTIPLISVAQSTRLYYYGSNYSGYYESYMNSPWMSFIFFAILPAMACTFVMPVFVFIYRTSLQASDCFRQAGYDDRTIKRTRILIGLGILIAAVTVAYLFGSLLLIIRHAASPESYVPQGGNGVPYHRYPLYYGYLFLGYLMIVLAIAAQYLINCFFASLGDSVMTQIFYMILGCAFSSLLIFIPYLYLAMCFSFASSMPSDFVYIISLIGAGPYQLTAGYVVVASPLSTAGMMKMNNSEVASIVSYLGNLLIGAGAGLHLFLRRDPSGEYAGRNKPRNTGIAILPHLAAFTIAIGYCCVNILLSGVSVLQSIFTFSGYAFFMVIYYALLSLMRKSFRPTKFDLIAYLSVCLTMLILVIVATGLVRSGAYY